MDNISKKSKQSFAWDLVGTFSRQFSTLVVSIVLARILTPEEFGVVGIALVFTSISNIFIDVGFTDGLIQQKEVSDRAYSSIFFINVGISFSLAALIFFSAGSIGKFYDSQEIESIVKMLAWVLPLSAFSKVHLVQLMKHLNFKSIAIRDIISTVSGGIIGIFLALRGFGAFSLVWQQLFIAGIGTLLLWYSTKWRPSLNFSWREVKQILSFSSFVFFDQVTKQIFQRLDTLFIGKVFSPTILGFYSRAESLNAQAMNYTSSSLQKVMFPVLSALQGDDVRFKQTYYTVFSVVAVVSSSIAGMLYFLAEKIIIGLLGAKWEPSIIIFQILIFRTLVAPYGSLMSKTLLSRGYSKLQFKIGLSQRFIMLVPLPVGFYFGIEVFTATIVLCAFVYFLLFLYILNNKLQMDFKLQIKMFITPLIPFILLKFFTSIFPISNTYVLAGIFIIIQFTFLSLFKVSGYLVILKEIKGFVKNVRRSLNV